MTARGPMIALPLERAALCEDEHVFDIAWLHCPTCGSNSITLLTTWLGSLRAKRPMPVKLVLSPLGVLTAAEAAGIDVEGGW